MRGWGRTDLFLKTNEYYLRVIPIEGILSFVQQIVEKKYALQILGCYLDVLPGIIT